MVVRRIQINKKEYCSKNINNNNSNNNHNIKIYVKTDKIYKTLLLISAKKNGYIFFLWYMFKFRLLTQTNVMLTHGNQYCAY